jgi:DNA-binding beta-propeller fold protein YncE
MGERWITMNEQASQNGIDGGGRATMKVLRPWGSRSALGLLAATLCLLLVLVPKASADTTIGTPGSGAGQYDNPQDVALDSSLGNFYLADTGNNRVDVFDLDGNFIRAFGWGVATGASEMQVCTTICQEGIAGAGPGQMSAPRGITADHASHALYVADSGNKRILKFTPTGNFQLTFSATITSSTEIASGPSGTVYAAETVNEPEGMEDKVRVRRFTASGTLDKEWELEVPGGPNATTLIAVDSTGDFYLSGNAIWKFDDSGTLLKTVYSSFNLTALAIDQLNHLYAVANDTFGQLNSPERYDDTAVHEFLPSGEQVAAIYGDFGSQMTGLASGSGALYIAESFGGNIFKVSLPAPPGPHVMDLRDTSSHHNDLGGGAKPREVFSARALLEGGVNPEGKATTFHFEVVDQQSYEEDVFDSSNTQISAEQPVPIPNPGDPNELFRGQFVEQVVVNLLPETTYHYRIVAEDSDGAVSYGAEGIPFTTLKPVEILASWATDVNTDSAILHAEADPLGTAATGYFEYVEQASYEASGFDEADQAPAVSGGSAPLDFGSGEGPVTRAALVAGLNQHTTYRYRLIASDHCKADPTVVCTFTGATHSFTTGTEAGGDSTGGCSNETVRIGVAASLPDCRGYELVSPVDKDGAGITTATNVSGFPAALEQAAGDGSALTYTAYKAFGGVQGAPYSNQYLSRRGVNGWETESIAPRREGPSLATYNSAYLDRQYAAFSNDLCRGWVLQDTRPVLAPGGIDGYPGLYRRSNCGPDRGSYETLSIIDPSLAPTQRSTMFQPSLQGVSADGSVAIFDVTDNLTTDAKSQPAACGGEPESSDNCRRRLYEFKNGELRLVCILPTGLPASGECTAGTAGSSSIGERTANLTHVISDDGSHVFWSAQAGPGLEMGRLYLRIEGATTVPVSIDPATEFLTAAADGSKAIYRIKGKVYEFDSATLESTFIADHVVGFGGGSEDASRLYLDSRDALAPGGVDGQQNMYFYQAGKGFTFIGRLPTSASGDVHSPMKDYPVGRTSRVTPDGERFVFALDEPLTDYDNVDAVSGERDQEVYLFDAAAEGGTGSVTCISCNPSGARPRGQELTFLKGFEHDWAAAWITTWQSGLHPTKVISDDGRRVFFNSFEGLVPGDSNGAADVYEWEVPGSGTCSEGSGSFQPSSGGCLYLISSGNSPKGSELVDLSPSGNDVFFKTYSSLVPQDPGSLDIYDARVGGGFPVPPGPPASCEGEACQPPIAAPNDPTPASSAYNGQGNVKSSGRRCPKGKQLVHRKGNQRCLKRGHKHRKAQSHRTKRSNNRRAAR